jgi:hypothetical protein
MEAESVCESLFFNPTLTRLFSRGDAVRNCVVAWSVSVRNPRLPRYQCCPTAQVRASAMFLQHYRKLKCLQWGHLHKKFPQNRSNGPYAEPGLKYGTCKYVNAFVGSTKYACDISGSHGSKYDTKMAFFRVAATVVLLRHDNHNGKLCLFV